MRIQKDLKENGRPKPFLIWGKCRWFKRVSSWKSTVIDKGLAAMTYVA
jgi:hypothetical protein